MTKDDIIRMAREAGVITSLFVLDGKDSGYFYLFERFANLVAAAEREAIATEFMERHEAVKHLNNYWHHAANYVRERGQHD
jgi:hypothetical protein